MKTILLTATYLIGAGELFLALFFWVTNSKNEIRRVMSLLAFSTGMWVILSAVTSYVPFSTAGYYETAFVYLFGALLLTALLHLSIIMPFPLIRFDKVHTLLIYFPLAFLSYLLFCTRLVVKSFSGSSVFAGVVNGGLLYSMYNVYLLALFVVSICIISFRLRTLGGMHRSNGMLFLWSVILGGLPGVILYLIFPSFAANITTNSLLGVIPSVLWVGATTYIVLKK